MATRVMPTADVHDRNARTRVAPLPTLRLLADADLSAALERIHVWRAEHPEGAALAVIVREGGDVDVRVEQLEAGTGTHAAPRALIVGRHASCDVPVTDASASLRHAAVILWPATATEPARAVAVDLRSDGGLRLRAKAPASSDEGVDGVGVAVRRLASSRALSFRAGGAEVMAIVANAEEPFAVRYADQLDAALAGVLVDAPVSSSSPGDVRGGWELSMIVRTRVAGVAPAIPEDALAIRATRADVERGVVLGRYERCERTTALAADANVSRVHAMLLAERGSLWLIDAASTNGTSLQVGDKTRRLGEGRRMARLPKQGRVFLAGNEALLVVDD